MNNSPTLGSASPTEIRVSGIPVHFHMLCEVKNSSTNYIYASFSPTNLSTDSTEITALKNQIKTTLGLSTISLNIYSVINGRKGDLLFTAADTNNSTYLAFRVDISQGAFIGADKIGNTIQYMFDFV